MAELLTASSPVLRIHGGVNEQELAALGFACDEVIDFSANINPYAPHPAVLEAIRKTQINRYPDSSATLLRRALGEICGVTPEQIVIGSGASDLLWLLAMRLATPHHGVLIIEPAFAEFRSACEAAGVPIAEYRAKEELRFQVEMDAVEELLIREKPKLLYLCSPNSPTGTWVSMVQIKVLAVAHPKITIVLDQSFLALSEHSHEANTVFPSNVICVRSLTKEHAIPGVRVGYLIAPEVLARSLETARPAWSINCFAQAAGLAVCGLANFVAESRHRMLADRERMTLQLRALGHAPLPSSTVFFLLPVQNAALTRRHLLQQGILVRDCSSFDLPQHIRICARPAWDSDRLFQALQKAFLQC
jgi:histidinol-phosphate aminotransferase